jgi:ketosteroid isomerase-like protein
MKPEQLKAIANQWMEHFNDRNLDGLLDLYHPQATHYSPKLKQRQPETNGLIQGKEALRGWWQDAFTRLPTLYYDLERLTASDDRVLMEYKRQLRGEADLLVAEVLRIDSGLIIESRVYHG